jgi:hypothetical protein
MFELKVDLFKRCFRQVRKLGSSTYPVYLYENITTGSTEEEDEFHFVAVKNIFVQESLNYE